ncbi:MAG: hypothetical protein AB8G77_22275 [Rhodothermales bacterium]
MSLLSTALAAPGGQTAMGHSDEQMTRHYAALVAKMSVKDATRLAESMGLAKKPGAIRNMKSNANQGDT